MLLKYLTEGIIKSAVFWLVGLFAVWLALGVFGFSTGGDFPAVAEAKWQAVFLSNDQVYFGKLKNYDGKYLTLSEVYYLRTAEDLQNTSSTLNLVKLGGELHGPEDIIFIPKSSVLFWENLKDTSRVVQSIEGAKQ